MLANASVFTNGQIVASGGCAPVFVGDEMEGAYGISGGTSGQDEEMSDYARAKVGWAIRAATDTLPQKAKDQINAIYQQVGLKDRRV
jgi:hypothetical protein